MTNWNDTTPRQLIEAHLAKTPNTKRGYHLDLQALSRWQHSKNLEKAVVALIDGGRSQCKRILLAWINFMRGRALSSNTIRRRVASVISLISLAEDLGIISWYIGKLPVPPAVRVRDCTGPNREAVDNMFWACQERDDAKGRRDEAILALLYWQALRASEVLSIRLKDVDLDNASVRIIGKRGQGRMTVGICRKTREAIARWLEARGDYDGALFGTCVRGSKVTTKPLNYWALRGLIRSLGRAVGIHCWPHGLRHAAISHLADLTNDSPAWGCALSRHRDVRAWAMYQDRHISHSSAADVLSRGQIVRSEPKEKYR